ncbi:MAG: hypothetical protein HYV08_09040 [Deltaproteobacteria bacterium]|nr:hypothetical protein [Deltaproteobacteria bacterium]
MSGIQDDAGGARAILPAAVFPGATARPLRHRSAGLGPCGCGGPGRIRRIPPSIGRGAGLLGPDLEDKAGRSLKGPDHVASGLLQVQDHPDHLSAELPGPDAPNQPVSDRPGPAQPARQASRLEVHVQPGGEMGPAICLELPHDEQAGEQDEDTRHRALVR